MLEVAMRSILSMTSLLSCLALALPAHAQQPAQPAPALNADMFKLPSSANDASKFNYAPPKTETGNFNPGRFDLGSSVLQLDTKRQEPDSRVGIEALDPKQLGGISKEDNSSPLPNYFGMTLSKPLN